MAIKQTNENDYAQLFFFSIFFLLIWERGLFLDVILVLHFLVFFFLLQVFICDWLYGRTRGGIWSEKFNEIFISVGFWSGLGNCQTGNKSFLSAKRCMMCVFLHSLRTQNLLQRITGSHFSDVLSASSVPFSIIICVRRPWLVSICQKIKFDRLKWNWICSLCVAA